jgi:hypothetical protein
LAGNPPPSARRAAPGGIPSRYRDGKCSHARPETEERRERNAEADHYVGIEQKKQARIVSIQIVLPLKD